MFKKIIIPCLLLVAGACMAQKPSEISLNSNWMFQKSGDAEWMKAKVPGTVHTDLMDNKKIPDPYYRNNEKEVQWVDKVDWVYKTQFDVPVGLLNMENLELDFKGLDTYADVYLNGKLLFKADNFFVGWTASIETQRSPSRPRRFRRPSTRLAGFGGTIPNASPKKKIDQFM